jgi:hypothetical protein
MGSAAALIAPHGIRAIAVVKKNRLTARARKHRFQRSETRRFTLTKRQASEWVNRQLIVEDMGYEQLVAAFTALADRKPDAKDRSRGLFRSCCEMTSTAGWSRPTSQS